MNTESNRDDPTCLVLSLEHSEEFYKIYTGWPTYSSRIGLKLLHWDLSSRLLCIFNQFVGNVWRMQVIILMPAFIMPTPLRERERESRGCYNEIISTSWIFFSFDWAYCLSSIMCLICCKAMDYQWSTSFGIAVIGCDVMASASQHSFLLFSKMFIGFRQQTLRMYIF